METNAIKLQVHWCPAEVNGKVGLEPSGYLVNWEVATFKHYIPQHLVSLRRNCTWFAILRDMAQYFICIKVNETNAHKKVKNESRSPQLEQKSKLQCLMLWDDISIHVCTKGQYQTVALATIKACFSIVVETEINIAFDRRWPSPQELLVLQIFVDFFLAYKNTFVG